MRILHVLDHSVPLQSGYSFRTRAILERQRARGWQTFHLTGPKHYGATAAVEEVDGLRFHRTPPVGGLAGRLPVAGQLAAMAALARRLEEVAREVRPDLIHAHSPALDGVAALRVARRLGLPVVYEVRAFWEDAAVDHGTATPWGPRYRATRALETWVLRRADAVVAICEGLRRDILARGIAPERVAVVPNAVVPERFAGAAREEALAAEAGLGPGPVVGFIGSFYAYEGLPLLVEAFARVAPRHPGARLLLLGGGPDEDAVRGAVSRAGLGARAVLPGRVPHDEVMRWYGLVDVFAYPRRSMRLTELVTPLKPLEAMAAGRAVVASDVGGHRELVRDGETGILFRAGDVAALAGALDRVLGDAALRARLGEAGRAFVRRERTWEASVARYAPVYEAVLGRGGQRAAA